MKREKKYPWEKEIEKMPKDNGFLSEEALKKLKEIATDPSKTEKERNYAKNWYISAT